MNRKRAIEKLNIELEEFKDNLKKYISGENALARSRYIAKQKSLTLKSFIWGLIGTLLGIGIVVTIDLFTIYGGFYLYLIVPVFLSLLFSSISAFQAQGGNDALKFQEVKKSLEERKARILLDIEQLKYSSAPHRLIRNAWNDYEELEVRLSILHSITVKNYIKTKFNLRRGIYSKQDEVLEAVDKLELKQLQKLLDNQ